MMNEQQCMSGSNCKRMSWSAVFAGALVGIGLSFLFNLLNVAIGLTVISTTSEGVASLAMGGLAGLLVGIVIAAFMGGFTAGAIGRPCCGVLSCGTLYGFLAWCVALILTALLTTNIGRYVASYSNYVANPSMIVVVEKPAMMRDMASNESAKEVKEAKAANGRTANGATMQSNGKSMASGMAIGSWLIFIVFAIGALFSAIGGKCGAGCCRKSCK